MELEEHFQPDEPREDPGLVPSEAGDCPAWVDAYEF